MKQGKTLEESMLNSSTEKTVENVEMLKNKNCVGIVERNAVEKKRFLKTLWKVGILSFNI